jgi:hypothetical protein
MQVASQFLIGQRAEKDRKRKLEKQLSLLSTQKLGLLSV